jgi:hypothetical protein
VEEKPTSLSGTAVLPSSLARVARDVVFDKNGTPWVPCYCANCGDPGGRVPECELAWAFYLCDECAERWSPQVGTLAVPMEVFFEAVRQEQLEREGRELTALEVIHALEDPNHYLSKLAKESPCPR